MWSRSRATFLKYFRQEKVVEKFFSHDISSHTLHNSIHIFVWFLLEIIDKSAQYLTNQRMVPVEDIFRIPFGNISCFSRHFRTSSNARFKISVVCWCGSTLHVQLELLIFLTGGYDHFKIQIIFTQLQYLSLSNGMGILFVCVLYQRDRKIIKEWIFPWHRSTS